jgi:hypothetical protein
MRCLGAREASQPGRGDRVSPTKPPFALSQGFPRKTILVWIAPRRGGLCTPASKAWAKPKDVVVGPRRPAYPSRAIKRLGTCTALQYGRAERIPPQNSLFAWPPDVTPPGESCWAWPPRGGAGSARPVRKAWLPPGDRPTTPPGVRLPPMVMLCLGFRTASQCGRGDRAPPRKPPFASFPGFPR